MSKKVRVVVMVAVLCGLHAVAEESCSRDVVVSAVERMSRLEHAQDRLEAMEAYRVRSGFSAEEWAGILFDIATNRNDRFVLQDMSRYASTNRLESLEAIVFDAERERSFRLAAFRVYALVDGFGERTSSLVARKSRAQNPDDQLSPRKLWLQINAMLPTNDVRRMSFENRMNIRQAGEND